MQVYYMMVKVTAEQFHTCIKAAEHFHIFLYLQGYLLTCFV